MVPILNNGIQLEEGKAYTQSDKLICIWASTYFPPKFGHKLNLRKNFPTVLTLCTILQIQNVSLCTTTETGLHSIRDWHWHSKVSNSLLHRHPPTSPLPRTADEPMLFRKGLRRGLVFLLDGIRQRQPRALLISGWMSSSSWRTERNRWKFVVDFITGFKIIGIYSSQWQRHVWPSVDSARRSWPR